MISKVLHIHSQHLWHDDAWIVGNKAALELLRDAIDAALATGRASCQAFVVDGEGFDISVIQTDNENIAVPSRSRSIGSASPPAIVTNATGKHHSANFPLPNENLFGASFATADKFTNFPHSFFPIDQGTYC